MLFQRHHELLPGDFMKRGAFALLAFQNMMENDDWLSKVLRTDEVRFTFRRSLNSHNCRIWATENSRTFEQSPLHDEKVMVWCGFTVSTIIVSFFFEEMHDSGFETVSVTGERCANMLQNLVIPSLTDKHTFMQDGALPDIAGQVK